jgi:hypothetical protein
MSDTKLTRKQALEEGKQKDASDAAKEAGLLVPVYITSTVWDNWITPDEEAVKKGENEQTRLRNVMDKLLYYIRVHRQTNRSNLIYFPVPMSKDGKEENVQLLSNLGPVERADNRPCITIMIPEEYETEQVN